MDECVLVALNAIRTRERLRIAFANPEFVVASLSNPPLLRYLRTCRLVLPDGVGIIFANRLIAGPKLPERVTGTDFLPNLCQAANGGFSLFLLGGMQGVAEQAAEELTKRFPNLQINGMHHGYFSVAEEPAIVEKINACMPDALMVCLGNPKQEEWIERNEKHLKSCYVLFGNGGALDFYSGRFKRAPNLLQRIGLEWLFRVFQEPTGRRISRQLNHFSFMWAVGRLAIRAKLRG